MAPHWQRCVSVAQGNANDLIDAQLLLNGSVGQRQLKLGSEQEVPIPNGFSGLGNIVLRGDLLIAVLQTR